MGGESGVERYPVRSDELIVALPESAEVLRMLDELGARERTVEDSTVLGLSRITVPDVHGLAEAVRAKVDATPGAGALVPSPRPTDRDIDRVLGGLRAIFKARYQRWSPRIGKNRLVGHLQGVGEISHGGTGDPQPTEPGAAPAARADAPGEGVRVGVLDTAVHPHPWLAGGWTARFSDVIRAGDVPSYAGGHATFVA